MARLKTLYCARNTLLTQEYAQLNLSHTIGSILAINKGSIVLIYCAHLSIFYTILRRPSQLARARHTNFPVWCWCHICQWEDINKILQSVKKITLNNDWICKCNHRSESEVQRLYQQSCSCTCILSVSGRPCLVYWVPLRTTTFQTCFSFPLLLLLGDNPMPIYKQLIIIKTRTS